MSQFHSSLWSLRSLSLSVVATAALASNAHAAGKEAKKVRIGYFPNITHAQALIGVGDARFQKNLGDKFQIEPFLFNAGPSAVEALFAGSIDLTYIGPNPAINAWMKARGSVRIISGSASGGARLIVREGAGIKSAKDFAGKKLATPQLGNTQDVAARAWLTQNGLKSSDKGGTVRVLPIKNADQLSLFIRGEIDAAWAVEPWASRLIHEGKGREFLDERKLWADGKFTTVVILTTQKFLKENSEVVEKLLAEHVEITKWIQANPSDAKAAINKHLLKLTKAELSKDVLDNSFAAMEFTFDPYEKTLAQSAQSAFTLGFLGKKKPDLSGLVDLAVLNKVLDAQKIAPISPIAGSGR